MCSSPWLFAAYHDLLRLAAPRHPPYTYIRLTILSFLLQYIFIQPLLIKLDTVTLQHLQQSKYIEVYVTCSLNTVSSINVSKLLFVLLPSLSMSNITLINPFYRLIFFYDLSVIIGDKGIRTPDLRLAKPPL